MKNIVFDAGSIISLTINNLLDLVKSLRDSFDGKFYIAPSVKSELIDVPFAGKKYKFEALQVMQLIEDGTLEIVDNRKISELGNELMELANKCFKVKDKYLKIVQTGEMETLALAISLNSEAFVIDEKTTRLLIENPDSLHEVLYQKTHTKVNMELHNVRKFQELTSNIKIIRSVEIVTYAYEKGLLDKFLPKKIKLPNARKDLLDSVLWGLKLNGCAVSESEIKDVLKIEKLS
jgi:predicted nucleic acid-binding protein